MKIKLAVGAAALSLIASTLSAQTIADCEMGIQLVGDIIADPVISSTTDPTVLANAADDLNMAVVECDGTEAGRVAALEILAYAAATLGHPLP